MDAETLEHLAELSRLGCTPQELKVLLPDMEAILALMDAIGDYPEPPDTQDPPLSLDMLREDRPVYPGDRRDESEKGETNGGKPFWVPRIV